MSGDVRDFLEQERALCSQALDGDRGVLIRAAEMFADGESKRAREVAELTQLLNDIKRRAEYSPLQLAEALHQRGVRIPTGYPLRNGEKS